MYRCIKENPAAGAGAPCRAMLQTFFWAPGAALRSLVPRPFKKACLLVLACLSCAGAPVFAADNATLLTLDRAVEIALAQNPGFSAAGLGIQQAEHRRKAARADFLPKLKTTYSYTHLSDPPEVKMPSTRLVPLGSLNDTIGSDFSLFSVKAVQPLFTGGEIYNAYQLEKLGVDIARLKNDTARNDLVCSVKAAYFTVLKAQKLLEVARQAVAQIASHEKTARELFDQEMIAKNELLEAQVRLAQAEQDQVRAEQSVELAQAALNSLLHQDVNAPMALADISRAEQLMLTLAESQALALERRPLIRRLDTTIRQAQTGVRLARGTYFPKLFFVSAYNRLGDHAATETMKYLDANTWSLTVNMDWTFFEWGKKSNVVGEQRVKLLESREIKKEIVDKVLLQVKDAWLRSRENWKNIGVSRTAISRAEENFRIYQNRFNQQMSTTTDVLDAQTLLTHARSNYNNSLYDYFISLALLENAVAAQVP